VAAQLGPWFAGSDDRPSILQGAIRLKTVPRRSVILRRPTADTVGKPSASTRHQHRSGRVKFHLAIFVMDYRGLSSNLNHSRAGSVAASRRGPMELKYMEERIRREILKRIGEAIRNELVNDPMPDDLLRLVTELDRRSGHC
jgi:hypothetical protein